MVNKAAGYAKTTLYIATTEADGSVPQQVANSLNQAGFEALNWVKVSKVFTVPSFGSTSNFVGQAYVDDPNEEYIETTIARPGTTVSYRETIGDNGQTAVKAAGGIHGGNFAFKHVLNDAPAGGTPTIRYVTALVGAALYPEGGTDGWQMVDQQVQPNSAPVIDEAAAA